LRPIPKKDAARTDFHQVIRLSNWWIIQSLESYKQHPDLIGCQLRENSNELKHPRFAEIKKGDKIVYYATGDRVVVGIFEVTSESEILRNDDKWTRPISVYHIVPSLVPPDGEVLDFKALLTDPDVQFKLFPKKNRWQYLIWNHYIHSLADSDVQVVRSAIQSGKYLVPLIEEETSRPVMERIGEPFKNVDLLYEPVDEMGLVYLFARYHKELGFPYVVKIRAKFPDVIAMDAKGERVTIELEYKSSNYSNNHPLKGCDYIVCWEDDWDNPPSALEPEIISVKERLPDIFKIRMERAFD
jgi:hypothetical protein